MKSQSRRDFLKSTAIAGSAAFLAPSLLSCGKGISPFKISLAEWSYVRPFNDNKITNLDFPVIAREHGIAGVEYVNTFFFEKAKDEKYLAELKKICDNEGVISVLIMCDREGQIGHPDETERMKTVDNHKKWVDAAKFLGCHSIRINAGSQGTYEETQKLVADGAYKLCEYGDKMGINILIENHGGLSSNGEWLSEVIEMIGHDRMGTLPDFGNFVLNKETGEEFDRYRGVELLMPYAKGVSAKSVSFNEEGNEESTDFLRMMKIVKDAGYEGFVGIEYSGSQLPPKEGVDATKKLLEKVFKLI